MAFPNWFNEVEYLNNKLADLRISDKTYTSILQVSDAIKAAGMNAFEHYTMFGSKEGLAPSKVFNVMEYCSFKLKALQADAATKGEWTGKGWEDVQLAIHNSGMSLGEHYTMFGTAEGVSMSNTFDTTAYLTAKLELLKADEATKADWAEKNPADVAKAFQDNGIDAYSHYMTFKGAANEVAADAVYPSKDPIGGGDSNTFILKSDTNTIVGTAGNDLIIGERGDVLNPTDTIDGGAGTDEMRLFNANASDLANLNIASIKNVEIIKAIGSVAAAIDVSGLKDVQEVWNVKSTLTSITVAEGQAVGLEGTVGTTDIIVKGTNSGTNELDLLLKDATAATLAVGDAAATASAANVSVETLNIEAAGKNSITALTADALKTLNITGTEGSFTLGDGNAGLDALKTIDATDYAGDVTIGSSGGAIDMNGAGFKFETYKGSTGADTVYVDADYLTSNFSKFDAGTGDAVDTLAVTGTTFDATKAGFINKATGWDVLEFTDVNAVSLEAKAFNINNFVFSNTSTGLAITDVQTADTFTFEANVGNTTANAGVGVAGLTLTGAGGLNDLKIALADSATIFGQAGAAGATGANAGNNGGAAVLASAFDTLHINSTGSAHSITGGVGGNAGQAGSNDGAGGAGISLANGNTVKITGDADLTILGGKGGTVGATGGGDGLSFAHATATTGVKINALDFEGKLTTSGSAEADTIAIGNGGSVIIGTAKMDTITFGGGTDKYVGGEKAFANMDTVEKFTSTVDKFALALNSATLGNDTTVLLANKYNASSGQTLEQALVATFTNSLKAAHKWAVVEISGLSTNENGLYVINNLDGANAYSAATDAVIKVVGVDALVASDFLV